MRKTFVLCHGTWHGGLAWEEVIQDLRKLGHYAVAPTMAGHGPGVERHGITHKDCAHSVAECVREHELRNVILVGHSWGGTVAQRVAADMPERTARVVFLDALVLNNGERVFDILPDVFLESLTPKNGNGSPAASENSGLLPPPPWETWRDNFIQDAPEDVARSTWERLSPEPSQVNLDTLDLTRFYSLEIPKSFIYCRQDKAMPPGFFHPRMSSRLGDFKLVEMDGSHEVMFTRPAELAKRLVEAGTE